MTPQFLVDQDGIVSAINAPQLRTRLGSTLSAVQLADFTVRNLGFVAVGRSKRAARLWIRPQKVKPQAMAAALSWLEECSGPRIIVSVFKTSWTDIVYGDFFVALQGIVDGVLSSARVGDFIRQDRRLDRLTGHGEQTARMCRRTASGQCDIEDLLPMLHGPLQDRYIVLRAEDGLQRVQGCGGGMPMLSAAWRRTCVGQRFEDLHDYEFGRWSVQAYHRAASQDMPVLEDLDVIINLPGRPRSRVTYTRVILPISRSDGSRLLLGTSLIDPSVNLRSDVRQEV